MGSDVLATSAAARAVFESVDAALAVSHALASESSRPLSTIILDGPEEELTLTWNAQPAIIATSCAILAAMRERLPDLPAPSFAAGHSLGEYSALVAAEALSLDDAVRLVRIRGRAMQDAVPPGVGAMSAIMGVDPARLGVFCAEAAQGEVVSPANFNAPGQIVIAGHAGAVARVAERVTAEKGRAIPLKVSAPFHCALMAPAARVVEAELRRIAFRPPRFPIVANFDARPNTDALRAKELLVRQIDGVVRWDDTLREMAAAGVTHAIEIGPGKVLTGLVKRIAKDMKAFSVRDTATLDELPAFLADARS
jgi:[acyl-carrier-protein] S-malonyltransferase